MENSTEIKLINKLQLNTKHMDLSNVNWKKEAKQKSLSSIYLFLIKNEEKPIYGVRVQE